MATKLLGNNYLLWVESAVAGTYNYPLGQGQCGITRNSSTIDTTSKDDGKYGSGAPGIATVTVSVDILPKLPDASGYTRLESLCNANPQVPFNIQIRKAGTAGASGDVVFQALVYGNLDSTSFPQNGSGAVKATFVIVSITTDLLA
jgi:predicted secreted protein